MPVHHRLPPNGLLLSVARRAEQSHRVQRHSASAGCREFRKFTSGACFFHGEHLIKAYSKTQAIIALSSAEVEYYSMVKAASEGLGLKAMTEDYERLFNP